jgi:DNA-directed RNA polymerase III subunit RPC6
MSSKIKVDFRLIAEGKNMGVLKSEIMAQVDVKKRDLTRMLAEFERKKLIKKVGSPKQKYFLYDVTPDHTVTGGAFYDNDRFDKELVDGITHILKPHLRQIMGTSIRDFEEDFFYFNL